MGMNHIALVGNVVQNPALRMTPQGIPVAEFAVAIARPPRFDGTPQDGVDVFKVVAWRKLAETVNASLKKGDTVSVEGRLLTRSFEQNGQRRKEIEIEAQSVEPIKVGGHVGGEEMAFAGVEGPGDEPAFTEGDADIPF